MDDWPNMPPGVEKNRIYFLERRLELCNSFASLAITRLQMGQRDVAQSVLAKAEKRYAAIVRFLPNIETVEHRKKIERKLNDLRETLDSIRRAIQF